MGDRGGCDVEVPRPYGSAGLAPVGDPGVARASFAELQARLARAYLSGNGAEVERVLGLVAEANYVLPPKTDRAA
ncbi:MAG TPA: hypothetical protein VH561_16665 [Micromonosporaceae bacterium]|jgi:hypothetical protein